MIALVYARESRVGYFSGLGKRVDNRMCHDPGPVAVGERAKARAAQGVRVICVVSRDYNVVNYLTHGHSGNVKIVEPFDPGKIPVAEFRPDVR